MKRIEGFKIMIDKTPPKYNGSIFLKSQYKELAEYVTSTKDTLEDALKDVLNRYKHHAVEGINLKEVKNGQ